MSDVVIRAEGLGKKYLIGHQSAGRERYTALRDVVGRQVKGLVRSARDMLHGRQIVAGDEVEEFWALKDVSFEIKRGEVVGIIGRNGAGKSTLLKVLSQITEPSTGRIEIKGRVASLLEVGTGFHPELTGRENIYLNGAILGMSRAEIRRKFDEIVAFAEVEKFLDTPVKRYSSGMYVRLAFAVAAHLEPEILVVDEVLAVGDAEFQKKCLGKMQDVAGHGRTVLFVSHNMAAVLQLCQSAILMREGRIEAAGPSDRMIELHSRPAKKSTTAPRRLRPFSLSVVRAQAALTASTLLEIEAIVEANEEVDVELRCFVRTGAGFTIGIASVGGFGAVPFAIKAGRHSLKMDINVTNLAGDHYRLDLEMISAAAGQVLAADSIDHLDLAPSPNAGDLVYLRGEWAVGHIRFPCACRLQPASPLDPALSLCDEPSA